VDQGQQVFLAPLLGVHHAEVEVIAAFELEFLDFLL